MEIKKIPIAQINPAPYNPRVNLQPDDPEYQKLEKSITTFGYVEPLVWNKRTQTLISGHQRFKVLVTQGKKEVEVSVVDLPLEKEKALNITLNKIEGRWDEDKLAGLLSELSEVPEFDLELTGFDLPDVSKLLDSYNQPQEDDNFDFYACVKAIKNPVTKLGDLIQLGSHQILCADAGSLDNIKLLLQDKKINLLHTDPPYNVNYYGGSRPQANSRPKKHKLWDKIYSDNFSQQDYEKWLKNIFVNINPYFAKGSSVYVWNGHRQFGPMHSILVELGFHVSCVITWAKERFAIGFGDYNQQTEFCMYGWKKESGSHKWFGPKNESTLWQIHRDPTRDYIHPTQKPIALAQRAIRNSSKQGDLVLDCFLGSGSTLIAAESLKRRCYGFEIDARYCDAIVRRYITYLGEDRVSPELSKKYLREVKL